RWCPCTRSGSAGGVERPRDAFDQALCLERLAEKADGAGLHRLPPKPLLQKRRDEDSGRSGAASARCCCSSSPFIPGICMSEMMHDTSSNRGDSRNSSAEAKAITQSPNDFTRFPVARRTDSSSSMTAIVGTLGGVESAFIARKWSRQSLAETHTNVCDVNTGRYAAAVFPPSPPGR
ncbi:MAG: hypothetical protein QOE49_2514, partial [Rhodospirillaceae bacterium]|nr:hypothetical protein [Rhodospirillaceae bacterium]